MSAQMRNLYATFDPKSLKPSGYNPNMLNKDQRAQLVDEIKRQGVSCSSLWSVATMPASCASLTASTSYAVGLWRIGVASTFDDRASDLMTFRPL